MARARRKPVDICFVCALAEEAEAAIRHMEKTYAVTFERTPSSSDRFYHAATISNHDEAEFAVHVSWPLRKGPVEMALHLSRIFNECEPTWAFMTGICAGDRREQGLQLGDIIVAERTFFYDNGKIKRDQDGTDVYLADTDTRHGDEKLLNSLQVFDKWKQVVGKLKRPISKHQQRDWLLSKLFSMESARISQIPEAELQKCAPDWLEVVEGMKKKKNKTPPLLDLEGALTNRAEVELLQQKGGFPYKDRKEAKCYIAPMASGSAVRSDEPFKQVRGPVRGTLAMDMEGAAFYRTAADFPQVRTLLVKAVSDYAGPDKDDSYHEYASKASAAYVISVMNEFILPVRKRKSGIPPVRRARVESERADLLMFQKRATSLAPKLARIWDIAERPLLEKTNAVIVSRHTAGSLPSRRGDHIGVLRQYYPPEDLARAELVPYSLSVNGRSISVPAVTKPNWIGRRCKLDSWDEVAKLVDMPSVEAKKLKRCIFAREKHQVADNRLESLIGECAASIIQSGTVIWNDPIYRLTALDFSKDALNVSFATEHFEDFRYSIGLLNEESKLQKSRSRDINAIADAFPLLRSIFLPDATSLVDFAARITVGGPQVIFAMATDDGSYEVPYQIRSRRVSEGQEMIGSSVMGYHQPLKDAHAEIRLSSTVYRELYEELFGGREVRRGREEWRPLNWFFEECEPLAWLRDNKATTDALTFECIGCGVNLIAGNCDFHVLVAIHDPAFHRKFSTSLHQSWETKSFRWMNTHERTAIAELLTRPDWAGQCLATFVEGLLRLKELSPECVRLPDLERTFSLG